MWQIADSYRRTRRLFSIVPICALILFVLLVFLPGVISSHNHWHAHQEPPRLFPAFLLSAALWSLSYVLRIPSHKAVSYALSGICFLSRNVSPSLANWFDTSVTIFHTVLFVTAQELLRLSSFVIISLHWHETNARAADLSEEQHYYASDAVFREVWFIGLAWAAAEVGVGIAQGYENLSLYDDSPPAEDRDNDDDDGFGNGIKLDPASLVDDSGEDIENGVGTKSSIDRLLACRPCMPSDAPERSIDLDNAITQLTNVKAREDLEEVYGMPFIVEWI